MEDHAAKLMPMRRLNSVSEMLHRAPAAIGTGTETMKRAQVGRQTETYVAAVSHELRNQLSAIIGSLNLIRGGRAGTIPAETTPMVEMAYRNAVRMSALLTDIMDAEKISAGKMDVEIHTVNLNEVIRAALASHSALADEKDIRIAIETESENIEVEGDPGRLEQIIGNLITNAVKFSDARGTVTIAVDATDTDARFSVTDRGPGIPVEFQARVFDMFATCDTGDDRNRSGVGLGLWITKALVEAQSGMIAFASEPGRTCFCVALPLSPRSSAPA